MKNSKKVIIVICFCILFLIISAFIHFKSDLVIDKNIYQFISNYFMNKKLTNILKVITSLGDPRVLAIMSFIILVLVKNKNIGLVMVANLLIVSNLNFWVKQIFKRERPSILRLITERGYSFPSGHAMVSIAYYGLIIYLIYKYVKNKKIRYCCILLFSVLIILIGFSRVYLGVHFVSDILGGYFLSLVYLIIFIEYLREYDILK